MNRTAQTNNNPPSVVVTAADNSELVAAGVQQAVAVADQDQILPQDANFSGDIDRGPAG